MTQPLHPIGAAEYDTYAAQLSAELDLWARGAEPYPYPRPITAESATATYGTAPRGYKGRHTA